MDGYFISEFELFIDAIETFRSFLEKYYREHGLSSLTKENFAYYAFYRWMIGIRIDAYTLFNLLSFIDDNSIG